jgi:hypothetical protein
MAGGIFNHLFDALGIACLEVIVDVMRKDEVA